MAVAPFDPAYAYDGPLLPGAAGPSAPAVPSPALGRPRVFPDVLPDPHAVLNGPEPVEWLAGLVVGWSVPRTFAGPDLSAAAAGAPAGRPLDPSFAFDGPLARPFGSGPAAAPAARTAATFDPAYAYDAPPLPGAAGVAPPVVVPPVAAAGPPPGLSLAARAAGEDEDDPALTGLPVSLSESAGVFAPFGSGRPLIRQDLLQFARLSLALPAPPAPGVWYLRAVAAFPDGTVAQTSRLKLKVYPI